MANFTPQFMPKTYEPGGTYHFIYSIASQIPEYDPFEIAVLRSHNKDETYPSSFCNTVVYGAHEIEIDTILKYNGSSNYSDPLMNNPKVFEDSEINLAYPVVTMFTGGATKFTTNMVFGLSVGDTVPSKVVIDNSGTSTVIKWYKNDVLVNSDTLVNKINNSFALAITASGNTISGYAYLFTVSGSDVIYTSGLKTNADVLTILNDGGYAGDNETTYGWIDDERGDFIVSRIFNHSGGDAYISEYAADGNSISDVNDKLRQYCENYDGYLGSDLVSYIANKDTNAEAWTYLLSAEGDGTEYIIPVEDEHEYKIVFEHTMTQAPYLSNVFVVYIDGNYSGYFRPSSAQSGSNVYVTWYPQSQPFESHTKILLVYLGINYQYQFFDWTGYLDNIDYQQFDNWGLLEDMIEGYDPNAGQEDEKQDDPEDVDDPDYDALASGFLYAFMVDSGDMVNLADALVPETLAEKIRADFGNNLFEFIVSYHIMPCLTNADSLNKTAIAYRGNPFLYGSDNTQLMLAPISKSIYTVSCGSKVCLPTGVRKNGFENWAHANVQLYLPFIGYVHLNTADVWGKTITISYKFDILQGSCVANIGVGNNGTIYSFEGMCKYSIPFTTAIDHSNQALLSGIMSSAGAAVSIGGVVAGGSPTGLLNAAGGIANAAGDFLQAAEHKSLINRSGCLSGSPGWNMPRKPALIITVPNYISPGMTYNDINGYPTFKTGTLNNWLNNYVEVAQIDLKANVNANGASPNDSELDMINSMLKGGVYV